MQLPKLSIKERKELLLLVFLLVVLPISFYLLGGFTKASITSFGDSATTTYEVINSWVGDWLSSVSWIENNPFWDPLVANNVFVIVALWAISFSAVSILIVKRKKVGAWISG